MERLGQILEYFTYSPRDLLHFSPRIYFRLFEAHNRAVWPAQVVSLALGAAMLWMWGSAARLLILRDGPSALLRMRSTESPNPPHPEEPAQRASRRAAQASAMSWAWKGRAVCAILAVSWLFVAYAYFFRQLSTIHLAGTHFAWAFVVEAALLLWFGVARGGLALSASAGARRWGGLMIVAFALVIQPMAAPILGRPWAQAEIFGIAPDPTVAATLGVLAAADFRARPWLMVLPLAWCAVTGVTLWTLHAPEFWLMPAIGVVAVGIAVWRAVSRAGGKRFNHEGTKTRRSE